MKRDWEVIRTILAKAEAQGINDSLRIESFPESDRAVVSYNVDLLLDAGLLNGDMARHIGPGPFDFHVRGMSWEGHELYDAISSDSVWKTTKAKLSKLGGTATIELVKVVASEAAKAIVGS